jgi:hypothetical protein
MWVEWRRARSLPGRLGYGRARQIPVAADQAVAGKVAA